MDYPTSSDLLSSDLKGSGDNVTRQQQESLDESPNDDGDALPYRNTSGERDEDDNENYFFTYVPEEGREDTDRLLKDFFRRYQNVRWMLGTTAPPRRQQRIGSIFMHHGKSGIKGNRLANNQNWFLRNSFRYQPCRYYMEDSDENTSTSSSKSRTSITTFASNGDENDRDNEVDVNEDEEKQPPIPNLKDDDETA